MWLLICMHLIVFRSIPLPAATSNPKFLKTLQAVFLDDLGPNVKAAREMGISTVLVKDTSAALKELQEVTGIDVS